MQEFGGNNQIMISACVSVVEVFDTGVSKRITDIRMRPTCSTAGVRFAQAMSENHQREYKTQMYPLIW